MQGRGYRARYTPDIQPKPSQTKLCLSDAAAPSLSRVGVGEGEEDQDQDQEAEADADADADALHDGALLYSGGEWEEWLQEKRVSTRTWKSSPGEGEVVSEPCPALPCPALGSSTEIGQACFELPDLPEILDEYHE